MSKLQVNNNMLDYKGTTYNILQINTIQVVEIEGKNEVSFKFLKSRLLFFIIFTFIGISYFLLPEYFKFYLFDGDFRVFSQNGFLTFHIWNYSSEINLHGYEYYAISFILLGGIILFFAFKKTLYLIKNKIYRIYGLSFKMANGENPVFISNNKTLLFEIRDGINRAINKEDSSINFGNVNIDITDSANVEIGNIVRE